MPLPQDGHPPTLDEHIRIMADRNRPLAADPIGFRPSRDGEGETIVLRNLEPDRLRRLNIPVEGERTPEEADRILNGATPPS